MTENTAVMAPVISRSSAIEAKSLMKRDKESAPLLMKNPEDGVTLEKERSLLTKGKDLIVGYLPGGQYFVAKERGRSPEELKWFKRLEAFRAGFLGLATLGAVFGDPLSTVINATAYLFTSIPANIDPPAPGQNSKISLGRGITSVFSSPRLATYFAALFLANNIAAFGGPNMMYAENSPFTNVDTITHFMGGVSFGKTLNTFYEGSGIAGRLKNGSLRLATKIKGDYWVSRQVKELLKKTGNHAAFALTVGSFGLIGPLWEGTELLGASIFRSSSTAIAALKESSFNYSKDMVMNALGGGASFHIGKGEEHESGRKENDGEKSIRECLKKIDKDRDFDEAEIEALLAEYIPNAGKLQKTRVLEAAAMASYHNETGYPKGK